MQDLKNLNMLSFQSTQISSLQNFPTLPNLKQVELTDNLLTGAELIHLCGNENLAKIGMANNKITTIKELECLIKLPNLKSLVIMGNPVCESDEQYKEKVFELIP